MFHEHHVQTAKGIGDVAAGSIALATVMAWLPPIAALFTILYTTIRIWESATVRRLLRAVCARCADWWDR